MPQSAKTTSRTKAKSPDPEAQEPKAEETVEVAPVEEEAPVEEAAAPPEAPEAPKIPVERLVAQSDAFTGYPQHVLVGALSGDSRTELTPDEARAACATWLGN